MQDHAYFENLVKKSSPYIYTLSYRLTASPDDAGDLMQETYIMALKKLDQLVKRDDPLPWLRKICLNIFIDKNRKNNLRYKIREVPFPVEDHEIFTNEHTPEEEFIFNEEVKKIKSQCYSILSTSLSLYQRIVFVLVDIFKIKMDEVSRLIGKSEPAIKSLLYRARNRMNRHLGSYCSIVNPDNFCKCGSWVSFAHDIQKRREILQEMIRNKNLSFDKHRSMENMLALFNTLPFLNPSNEKPCKN